MYNSYRLSFKSLSLTFPKNKYVQIYLARFFIRFSRKNNNRSRIIQVLKLKFIYSIFYKIILFPQTN